MATIEELFASPDFKTLPLKTQLEVARRFPDFASMEPKAQGTVLARVNLQGKTPTAEPDLGFFGTLKKDAVDILSSARNARNVGPPLGPPQPSALSEKARMAGSIPEAAAYTAARAVPGGEQAAMAGEDFGAGRTGAGMARAFEALMPVAAPSIIRSPAGKATTAALGRSAAVTGEVATSALKKMPGAPAVAKMGTAVKGIVNDAIKKTAPKPAPKPGARVPMPSRYPEKQVAPTSPAVELPSGRKPGPAPAAPEPVKTPRTAPEWKGAPTPSKAPEAPAVKPEGLPSGRKPGPASVTKEPRKAPEWKAAKPAAAAPAVEPPKTAPTLPSGRKPGSIESQIKEAVAEAPKGRAPRDSDAFYKTHGQVRKAMNIAEQLHKDGLTVEKINKLTPEQRAASFKGHSEETVTRILFELRGLETGKIKPRQ